MKNSLNAYLFFLLIGVMLSDQNAKAEYIKDVCVDVSRYGFIKDDASAGLICPKVCPGAWAHTWKDGVTDCFKLYNGNDVCGCVFNDDVPPDKPPPAAGN